MHSLSASFVLGYHGCDRETGERILKNEPFLPSENDYDWLGSGIYFWETNPDRALDWARQVGSGKSEPFVVGAVIDPGFCLDMISSNGIASVEDIYAEFVEVILASGGRMPENTGGTDHLNRKLDCAVLNFLHIARRRSNEPAFDTIRGIFIEGAPIYPNSGFRRKTHTQICVRNQDTIKGVFRVPPHHFTANP